MNTLQNHTYVIQHTTPIDTSHTTHPPPMPPPHHHHRHRLLILLILLFFLPHPAAPISLHFHEAPSFLNPHTCPPPTTHPTHIAMTLDLSTPYLRGSLAAVLSVLRHSHCPHNTVFHFLAAPNHHSTLRQTISSTFPYLKFQLYPFNSYTVSNLISSSVRHALDQPLNYARIYLANLLPQNITRVVYLDSDLIAVDDIATLFNTDLNGHVLGAPEYCHANFTSYFTERFWKAPVFSSAFKSRTPCYFNTGVMVIDLVKWREQGLTKKLEYWMRVQRRHRIYELGSLPPFLLVFAGNVGKVEQRWNQHGLGGDNVEGLCRDLHPGPVSLLHWSGKGKPWLRLDQKRACTLDYVWAPYDLYRKRDDHQNRAVYLDSL